MQLSKIINGWANYFTDNSEVEAMAKERIKECITCPEKKESKELEKTSSDWRAFQKIFDDEMEKLGLSKLSEKELLNEVLKRIDLSNLTKKELLTEILKVNKKTSGWISFFGWVALMGITFYVLMALSLLP
jgi:hypothetical protein